MKRALVVLSQTSYADVLLREAAQFSRNTDADLVVVGLQAEDAHTELQSTVAASGGNTEAYGVKNVLSDAEQMAADAVREHIDIDAVDPEVVGKLGQDADTILRTAAEYNCDHIFIRGADRSPTGKAMFGDTAQRVILNFEGPVTVITP